MDADSRHKEIGKDIDHYISHRKGGGMFGWFSKKDAAPQEVGAQESAQAVGEPMPEQMNEAVESMPDEQTAGEPKKHFWNSWFSGKEEEQTLDEQPSEPVVDEDLREVARITLGFIKMTDNEARSRIKSSADFEKFKEILKRRQVIK